MRTFFGVGQDLDEVRSLGGMAVLSTTLFLRTVQTSTPHAQASAADSTLKCGLENSLALSSAVLGGRVKSSLLVNCRILDADIEGYVCVCVCVYGGERGCSRGVGAWRYVSRMHAVAISRCLAS